MNRSIAFSPQTLPCVWEWDVNSQATRYLPNIALVAAKSITRPAVCAATWLGSIIIIMNIAWPTFTNDFLQSMANRALIMRSSFLSASYQFPYLQLFDKTYSAQLVQDFYAERLNISSVGCLGSSDFQFAQRSAFPWEYPLSGLFPHLFPHKGQEGDECWQMSWDDDRLISTVL